MLGSAIDFEICATIPIRDVRELQNNNCSLYCVDSLQVIGIRIGSVFHLITFHCDTLPSIFIPIVTEITGSPLPPTWEEQ